jgi:hypothetical protein
VKAISSESAKSGQRHQQTSTTIVAKQEEAQVKVTDSIGALEATSRAEHEASRREIE